MSVKLLLVVLAVIILNVQGAKLPSFVQLCSRNDPNLNQCYIKSFNIVLKLMANGIPEMRLRRSEPVLINKISVDRDGTSLALDGELTNVKAYGITAGRATSAAIDLDKLDFTLGMEIPSIYMEADYLGKGKFLSFAVESKGTFNGNITGITAKGRWTAEKEIKNGKTWVRNWTNQYLTLDIKDIKVYFDNLLPNKQITDETNRAINENIDLLYKDLSPIIKSTITTIMSDAANNFYDTFSLEELFPE